MYSEAVMLPSLEFSEARPRSARLLSSLRLTYPAPRLRKRLTIVSFSDLLPFLRELG